MKKIVLRHNGCISYKRMQDKGCFAQWVKWVHRLVSVWDRIPQTCVLYTGMEVDGRKSKDLSWKVPDSTGENRRDCVSCTVKDDDRYQKSSVSHVCLCSHTQALHTCTQRWIKPTSLGPCSHSLQLPSTPNLLFNITEGLSIMQTSQESSTKEGQTYVPFSHTPYKLSLV